MTKKTPLEQNDFLSEKENTSASDEADGEDLLGSNTDGSEEEANDEEEAYVNSVSGTERLIDSLQATVIDFGKTEEEAGRPFSHHDIMGAVAAFYEKTKVEYAKAVASEADDIEEFDTSASTESDNEILSDLMDDESEGEDDDAESDGEDDEQETEH